MSVWLYSIKSTSRARCDNWFQKVPSNSLYWMLTTNLQQFMRTLDADESQEMNRAFFSNCNRPHAQNLRLRLAHIKKMLLTFNLPLQQFSKNSITNTLVRPNIFPDPFPFFLKPAMCLCRGPDAWFCLSLMKNCEMPLSSTVSWILLSCWILLILNRVFRVQKGWAGASDTSEANV